MSRIRFVALSLILTAASSGVSLAQQPCGTDRGFCQSFHYDFYRNKRWPTPFRAMDTTSVLSYFDVQRNNGWRLHNTLGTAMFDPNTHCLTESGRAHAHWIVKRAPQNRRVVFVLQGDSPEHTAKRIESVQLAVSEVVPVGPLPSIYLTNQDAPGSSGVYQTAIVRAMTTSVPAPRLPEGTAPTQ